MRFLVGDPHRATPHYTRFAILAALGSSQPNTDAFSRHGRDLAGAGSDDPNERSSLTRDARGGVEWPPLETDSAQRVASKPPRLDPQRLNADISRNAFGARVIGVRRGFDLLRTFRLRPAAYRVWLDDGREAEIVLKASLRGLEQEQWFYQELSERVRVGVPRLLGRLEGRGREEPDWLILERLPEQVASAAWTADHVRLTLFALANLHAQFWDSPALQELHWLPVATKSDASVFSSRLIPALDAIWSRQQSLKSFPRLLSEKVKLIGSPAAISGLSSSGWVHCLRLCYTAT